MTQGSLIVKRLQAEAQEIEKYRSQITEHEFNKLAETLSALSQSVETRISADTDKIQAHLRARNQAIAKDQKALQEHLQKQGKATAQTVRQENQKIARAARQWTLFSVGLAGGLLLLVLGLMALVGWWAGQRTIELQRQASILGEIEVISHQGKNYLMLPGQRQVLRCNSGQSTCIPME